MRRETGVRGGRGPDLGDVDGTAGQRREDQTVREVAVGGEAERGLRGRHLCRMAFIRIEIINSKA